MKTLKEVKIGETCKVVRLHGEGAVKRRIMDMGITKGVDVFVRKVAPLGDPVEVTVRGYELSLRNRARLTAWYSICLHIFRHAGRKSLDRRQPACGLSVQPDEKSDGASRAPSPFAAAFVSLMC